MRSKRLILYQQDKIIQGTESRLCTPACMVLAIKYNLYVFVTNVLVERELLLPRIEHELYFLLQHTKDQLLILETRFSPYSTPSLELFACSEGWSVPKYHQLGFG